MGAGNREKNDNWECDFLRPGKELGFQSVGNGKPFEGFNREYHHLISVLKKSFFRVERGLLL